MSKESVFVPLSELNYSSNNYLRVNLDLPFGLDEKIGINVRKIDKLRQIGGCGKISISVDNDSETSQTVPQIDGINNDGTAISRGISVKPIPEGSFDFQKNNNTLNKADWPNLKIKINVNEIQQRILQSENSILDNSAWSKELNKTLKHNILKGGTKHLLPKFNEMKFSDGFRTTWFYLSPFWLNDFKVDLRLIPYFLTTTIMWNGFDSLFYGFEKKGKGNRASLTFGPEIERAVVLNIYGRIGESLVKVLDK